MPWGANLLKRLTLSIIITTIIIIFDYLTKRLVLAYIDPFEVIPILPFLRLVHVQNKGAAFGLFSNISNTTFIILSLIATVLVVSYLFHVKKRLEVLSLSFILGGAIGNLIDRLTIGRVIDFIDLFVGRWHWPAFNVADSALTIGLMLFIISNVRDHTCL
ncbi:MAG: signal peptidase II [Thermodesulfovibrionia bacterium]